MNSETPQPSREPIEIRLTALLLGELPPAEAELLRWSMAQDPELAKLHDRLKSTIGLVREVSAQPADETAKSSAPLKMSEERRQKLLAHFKTVQPREFVPALVKPRRKTSWLLPLAAVLVVTAMLAVMLLPALSTSKKRAESLEGQSLSANTPGALVRMKSELEQLAAPTLSEPAAKRPQNAGQNAEAETPVAAAGLDTNAVAPLNADGTADDFSAGKSPIRSPLVTTIALPPANDAGGSTVAPTTPPTFANGVNPGGGFGGVGGGGGGGTGGGVSGNFQNSLADNRSKPSGGVLSQSIVGYVNESPTPALPDTSTTTTFAFNNAPQAGEPVQSQRYYRELNSDGGAMDKLKLPHGGSANQAAFKDSKKDSTALADTTATTTSGAIVLPPNPDSDVVTMSPAPAPAIPPGAAMDLGVASNGASTPTTTTFDDSTKLAYNLQPDASQKAMQKEDRREPHMTFGAWRALVPASPSSTTRSALQTRESVPNVYAQPADIAAATGMPGSPAVSIDAPPPAPASIPESAVAPPAQLPASGHGFISGIAGAFRLGPGPASASMPATLAPPPPIPMVAGGSLPRVEALKEEDQAINQPPDAPIPQPEVFTKDNTFSTFSLNVSDVSYKLAAASLENEQMPQPGAIRSEEFLNAFDYRDPEPPAGSPIGFAWERAGDPFAHNRDFLRFSVKTAAAGRAANRTLNLVILLDKSGSMERADRVAIIQEALKVLASQLKAHDKLSVVTFARTARLYADGVSGKQATKVFGKVTKITPEGGTNLEEAMNLAYQTALRHYLTEGVNRVVLLTDGAANLGDVDPQHLQARVEKYRKQGVALDCFGIGWEDYNDDLLADLSSHADGRYGFLNHPEDVAEGFANQLAGALKVAAADVKVQVEFNPARVTAYRQIGYAKHQLTTAQFRDNTVTAAAIGAAEAGNGLYTVQINPEGDGPVATVRVRFHTPGKKDYQERSWIVPYTGTAVALDRASPAMRLAATASSFAEWLQSSPYASDVTADKLLEYLKGVPEIYGADKRPQKLEWMIRQAQSIQGKG